MMHNYDHHDEIKEFDKTALLGKLYPSLNEENKTVQEVKLGSHPSDT